MTSSVHPTEVIGEVSINSIEGAGDWFTKVCLSHANRGTEDAEDGGGLVVEFECPVINVDLINGEVRNKIREKMLRHAGALIDCLCLLRS